MRYLLEARKSLEFAREAHLEGLRNAIAKEDKKYILCSTATFCSEFIKTVTSSLTIEELKKLEELLLEINKDQETFMAYRNN